MNRFASTSMILAASLSAAGLLAQSAAAQQRAGGDGRARDANQRVGSGGVNSAEGQVDYSIRNDMVTGDVAGGRALQIEQPYRAANEFGDTLGSDDLFDFRAQSLPSAPTQLNAVQRPINLGGGTAVFRSFSSAPTITDQYGAPRRVGAAGGFITPNQLIGSDLTIQRDEFFQPTGPFEAYEGVTPGRALEVIRAPLGAGQPAISTLRPVLPTPTPDTDERQAPAEEIQDPRQDSRLELPQYRPILGEPTPEDGVDAAPEPGEAPTLSPTMLMGRQLQSRLGSERGDRLDPMVEQRINRLNEQILTQAGDSPRAQDDSPYANLLSAVQQGEGDSAQQQPTQRARIDLGTVDESQTEQAERQRAQALRRAFGQQDRDEEAADEEQGEDAGPTDYTDPLAGLLDRLNYDLPALGTLAGDQQTRTNQLMKEAETALGAGQYFDAERLYRQVVQQQADDPMAKVGLTHAQLGAGMIRSAAMNLRSLFEQHPEMIAARYQANLLPAEDRLRWVRGELEEALQAGESGSEPALLLAYLGYQVDSRQLIRYGLATAEARAPRDPLMPVLRHIWLDQADNSSNSDQ